MANRKKTVEIDFIADTSKATRGIKDVGDTAEQQGGKFQKMGTAAKVGFGLAAAGVGIAIDFLKDATVAAAEDEAAQVDLALALKNTTGATDDQIAATEKFITKTSLATGVADDELRPALENLVRATGDLGEAQDLLGVAMDVSAAKGKPLAAITEAMGKAANGNVGALGRLGIATKDAEGKALTFEEAMAEANRTMGGAADAAAKTGLGGIKRFGVVIEEFKESIGGPLLDALSKVIDGLLTFKEELDTPGNQSWGDAVIGFLQDFDSKVAGQGTVWLQNLDRDLSIFEEDVTRFADVGLPALGAGMDAARHAAAGMGSGGIDPLTGDVEELTGAEEDLAGATDDVTTAIQRQLDKMRETVDPIFAAAQKVDALREAQLKLIEVQGDTAASSADLAEAELAVVEALFDAQGAMDDLSPSALNAAIASIQTATGKSKEEVMLLLEQLGILDGKTVTTYVDIRQRVVGGGSSAVGITSHTGGTVPGQYRGQEVPIMARAGEHVSQGGRPSNGHSGWPEVVQVVIDGKVIGQVSREQAIRDKKAGRSWG